jgi:membrane protein
MVLLAIKQFGDPYYQGFAAQIAFYIMLSVVPTVVLLSQALGFLGITNLSFLNELIDRYLTPSMGATIKALLANGSSFGNNLIMIVTAIWAASRAQFSLMRIANYIYSVGRTTGNFFTERLRSLRTMFLTIFTLVFVILIIVYGKDILVLFAGKVIETYRIVEVWNDVKWFIAAGMYFLLMLSLNYILPESKIDFRATIPGSVFSAIGLVVVTMLYSTYTRYVVSFNVIYGSLSSIAGLMFWFYFIAWVLVLGVLLNRVVRDTKGANHE